MAGGDPEAQTRAALQASYRAALVRAAGDYEPVWNADGTPRRLGRYQFQEIQRKLRIFGWLDRMRFATVLDVGSGFDVFPALIHARYGATTYGGDFVRDFTLPYGGAESGKLARMVTFDAARLPFADGAFDVVIASEVLEHLVRPLEVIAELLRVSRTAVLMTSLEALSPSAWLRRRSHWLVDVREPHVERNFFLLAELEAVFGRPWVHENLFYDPDLPISSFAPEDAQRAAYARLQTVESLIEALGRATRVRDHRPGAMGILIVKPGAGTELGPAPDAAAEAELARWLMARTAAHERFMIRLAGALAAGEDVLPPRDTELAAHWWALLRCPDCRGTLAPAAAGAHCPQCDSTFPVEHGVPIMYPRRPVPADDEALLSRLCGTDPARRRTVGRVRRRLRRNERPPGALRRLSWRLLRGRAAS